MADAHKRRFDVVAVWKFDRFARFVSHLLRALDTFRVLGIEFVSLSESLEQFVNKAIEQAARILEKIEAGNERSAPLTQGDFAS